ncbi:auxin transporter-like protein 4 [Nymphaea colorata]|nr:auxin transporter-like protein 4 [Nymphaea colorata]
MEAMWRPKKYKYAYACAVLYTYLLTIPDSVAVYWAYGDILLHRSNAFGVLPPSKMKNACIISMILHQYVAFLLNVNPLFLAWEKLTGVHLKKFALRALVRVPVVLIQSETEQACRRVMFFLSAFIAVWVFIFGFGFGGWASMTKFVQQIQSFGFFDKCYQCPTKHYVT